MSAAFFIASSLGNGDVAGLLGALFFLGGCLVFLFPLLRRTPPEA